MVLLGPLGERLVTVHEELEHGADHHHHDDLDRGLAELSAQRRTVLSGGREEGGDEAGYRDEADAHKEPHEQTVGERARRAPPGGH